jgi:transposase
MEILVDRACGMDVHKATVVACIMGTGIKKEIRTFTTMTNDLLHLKHWLTENRITHVAMESTGVYWKPVFNILEGSFEVILANARHVKNVPGRKTDADDSAWLCKLLTERTHKGELHPAERGSRTPRSHPVQEEAYPGHHLREAKGGEDPRGCEHQALLHRLQYIRGKRKEDH